MKRILEKEREKRQRTDLRRGTSLGLILSSPYHDLSMLGQVFDITGNMFK